MDAAMKCRRLTWIFAAFLGIAMVVPAGSTASAQPSCDPPVASSTQPGYTIFDPDCDIGTNIPFVPTTDPLGDDISTVYAGISNGAAYRIEVPDNWNNKLVLFAHGFRGTGTLVWVESPTIRNFYVNQGFAWAASSFQTNGSSTSHVTDTHDLVSLFGTVTGRTPTQLYATGKSAGGLITVAMIEQYRGEFVGA